MPPDPNEPITLTSATTEFQAATVARALESRGIPARVIGALTTGFRAEAPGLAHITVLRKDLDRAQAALKDIHSSASADEIDWSEAERHPAPDNAPVPSRADRPPPAPIPFRNPAAPSSLDGPDAPATERGWAWTLILVVLVPIGGFLTVLTYQRPLDPATKAIGPVLLGVAAVMALWLYSTKRDDDDRDAANSR